jgi:exopolysaccharide biosynthesis polyprenyl glycosylphosphotransferase
MDESAKKELQTFAPVLGEYTQLSNIVSATNATRLIVASPADSREVIESVALAASGRITIDIVPDVYEILFSSTYLIVGDIPLMRVADRQQLGYSHYPKRAFDLFLSVILGILLAPVMLVAMIAVKLEEKGPVFYRQERVGKGGRHFTVMKFRTMSADAEQLSGPVMAEANDSRITRVGKVLRALRIDELPQILNVISGSMSFIGPRPERPFFVEQFLHEIEGYEERLRVLPGITGLAQINGGYATSPELKLKYDLMYVYHQSCLLDLQMIVETIRVVLTGRGAR